MWVAEFRCGLVAFGCIAGMATKHEVAHPVGAATTPGHHMVDPKGGLATPTVHAAPPKFPEQVTPDFPATQRPSLIQDACDLRMLKEGRVEFDPLDLDPTEGYPSVIAICPGEHIADA
jgi:hypothetical protein